MLTPDSKLINLLEQYPGLKSSLIDRNIKFERLNNPLLFNSVGKIARIKDIAKFANEDLDELLGYILHFIETQSTSIQN